MNDAAGGDEAGGDAADGHDTDSTDALLSRLRLIEDQPLQERAAAFVLIHDELRRALEGADAPASRD